MTVEPLRAGKVSELIIKFTNPTQHQTVITFLSLDLTMKEEGGESQSLNLPEVILFFCVFVY